MTLLLLTSLRGLSSLDSTQGKKNASLFMEIRSGIPRLAKYIAEIPELFNFTFLNGIKQDPFL